MKDTAKSEKSRAGHNPGHDIGILVKLSAVHGAFVSLPSEGDGTIEDERASRLASGLSPGARIIYRSLIRARKWPFAIGLNGDSCSGCNMRLPSGLLGDIRRVTSLHRCPFCKRVLADGMTALSS